MRPNFLLGTDIWPKIYFFCGYLKRSPFLGKLSMSRVGESCPQAL